MTYTTDCGGVLRDLHRWPIYYKDKWPRLDSCVWKIVG